MATARRLAAMFSANIAGYRSADVSFRSLTPHNAPADPRRVALHE